MLMVYITLSIGCECIFLQLLYSYCHEWNNKEVLNALVRTYSVQECFEKFGIGWNKLYKNLLYCGHINLKTRRSYTGDERQPLIDFIRDEEFPNVIKVAIAMCEDAGLDIYKIINSVNIQRIVRAEQITQG